MVKTIVQLSFNPNRTNIGRRVIAGASWQFGLMAIRILITISSTAFLARLLTPDDYGLIAMSSMVTEIAALLANTGFGQILIQKKTINRLQLDSVFWISVMIGVGLYFLTALISVPAAWFFEQDKLAPILWVSGLNFVVREMAVVPSAIMQRLMLFRAEALIMLAQLVLRSTFAIVFAWMGWGYWSLVVGPLISGSIEVVCSIIYIRYWPRLRFNKSFLRSNIRQNTSFLGSGILHYLMSNFDYMIVGKRFGAEQLGFYQMAYSLPDELRNRLSGPLQRVLFPAFSLLKDDLDAFRRGVQRSQRMLSLMVLPIGAGLALTAEEIVLILYGEQWRQVIPLLRILAIGGALRAMFSLVSSIYYACGRVDLAFKIILYSAPFVIGAIFWGGYWGVEGVAWAMVFVMMPSFVAVHYAMKLINCSGLVFYSAILPALMATVFMVLVLSILQNSDLIVQFFNLFNFNEFEYLIGRYASWYQELIVPNRFIFKVVVGIISYCIYLMILEYSLVKETYCILMRKRC